MLLCCSRRVQSRSHSSHIARWNRIAREQVAPVALIVARCKKAASQHLRQLNKTEESMHSKVALLAAATAAFAPRTRGPPTASSRRTALRAEAAQAPSWKALRPRPGDVVIIDGDNCRGKSK